MRPSELQTKYQRNLLSALLVSCLVSVLFGVWVVSLGGRVSLARSYAVGGGETVGPDSSASGSPENDLPAKIGGYNPRAVLHTGFLGFINIRPMPDIPMPATPRPGHNLSTLPDSGSIELTASPLFGADGDGAGRYGAGGYFGDGGGVPPESKLADRDVEVAYMVEADYPFVAQDAAKEGLITALVFIDSTGRLALFPDWIGREGVRTLEFDDHGRQRDFDYAISEDPTDWFFATNFLKVLPLWKFTPSYENGIPVGSLLRIRCNFCLGLNCFRLELEQVQIRPELMSTPDGI